MIEKTLPMDQIESASNRENGGDGDLKILAEDIRHNGLINPVTVKFKLASTKDGMVGEYLLIAGRRRIAAARLLGWKEIPCRILTGDEIDRADGIALSEKRTDMREIEFRGKSKCLVPEKNNKWMYGYLWDEAGRLRIGKGIMHSFLVDPETVGQYTGLKDKNGVKIFEGDIVLAGVNKEKYIVRFCQGEYLLDASGNDCPCKMRENGRLSGQNTYYLKVIGNIHDNWETPEQLLRLGDRVK